MDDAGDDDWVGARKEGIGYPVAPKKWKWRYGNRRQDMYFESPTGNKFRSRKKLDAHLNTMNSGPKLEDFVWHVTKRMLHTAFLEDGWEQECKLLYANWPKEHRRSYVPKYPVVRIHRTRAQVEAEDPARAQVEADDPERAAMHPAVRVHWARAQVEAEDPARALEVEADNPERAAMHPAVRVHEARAQVEAEDPARAQMDADDPARAALQAEQRPGAQVEVEDSPEQQPRSSLQWQSRRRRTTQRSRGHHALAEEKSAGWKEGKNETEGSDVAGGDMASSLLALLPGIPNKTTLDVITPKLSWTDLLILSSMNRFWLEAIYNRQVAPVLDRRVVRAQGLETYRQLVLQVVKYFEYT